MLGFVLHLIKIMPISDGMYYSVLGPLAIAGLALGGAKLLGGLGQVLFAPKKQAEPGYTPPPEWQDIERRYAEAGGMAEPTMQLSRDLLQQSALFGLRSAQDRRGGLSSVPAIQDALRRGYADIAAKDAELRQRNFMLRQQAAAAVARSKDLAFQTQHASWMNREQQRRAQVGAGMQNMFGALDLGASMLGGGLFGSLGSGTAPGVGGSTYNPQSQFLGNDMPQIDFSQQSSGTGTYNFTPSSLSLYRGTKPYSIR